MRTDEKVLLPWSRDSNTELSFIHGTKRSANTFLLAHSRKGLGIEAGEISEVLTVKSLQRLREALTCVVSDSKN